VGRAVFDWSCPRCCCDINLPNDLTAMTMIRMRERAVRAVALVLVALVPFLVRASAQTRPPAPFEKLPSVQPEYDGWYRNSDGTLSFSFGYINRTEKPIEVPIGPNNGFTPGPADRGQPRVFQPGAERNAVIVVLPKDFNQNLVWTVMAGDMKASSTERGGLNPLYNISDVPPKVIPNDAPARPEMGPPRTLTGSRSTKLSATIRTNTSPDVKFTYKWTKRSGPGDVTFEPADASQTTASFSAPGEYLVRLTASRPSGMDAITGSADFKVVVGR
jgi:hypothetical protein